jgi:hypothetical protein
VQVLSILCQSRRSFLGNGGFFYCYRPRDKGRDDERRLLKVKSQKVKAKEKGFLKGSGDFL